LFSSTSMIHPTNMLSRGENRAPLISCKPTTMLTPCNPSPTPLRTVHGRYPASGAPSHSREGSSQPIPTKAALATARLGRSSSARPNRMASAALPRVGVGVGVGVVCGDRWVLVICLHGLEDLALLFSARSQKESSRLCCVEEGTSRLCCVELERRRTDENVQRAACSVRRAIQAPELHKRYAKSPTPGQNMRGFITIFSGHEYYLKERGLGGRTGGLGRTRSAVMVITLTGKKIS
jgi:hypothetical protein